MRPRLLPFVAATTVLLISCSLAPVWGNDAVIQLSIVPNPVARGEMLTATVVVDNVSGHPLDNTTLFAPLPGGVDQWAAEMRIDGGSWQPYPANGLIPLALIPTGGQLIVDVQTPVESGASGTLAMTVQLLDSTGVLAEIGDGVNILPSVDAGPDVIADLGGSIQLNAASASDGGNELAQLQWTDHGVGGAFDNANVLHPTYTPPGVSGVLELTLTATDRDGGEASDSLRLRVNATPTVTVGDDIHVQEGSTIPLGQAIVSDPDGWISTISWDDGGAGGTFFPAHDVVDPVYVVPELSGCDGSVIVLTLEGTDDWGATGEDSLTLLVTNANQPPVIHVPDDMSVEAGDRVTLSAIASDEDGWIAAQEWEQIDGVDVELLTDGQPHHAEFEAPVVTVAEDVRLRFTARDNCGDTHWEDVVVRVLPESSAEGSLPQGAVRVALELYDSRGFPLSLFETPLGHDSITATLTVINTGLSRIENLVASLSSGEDVPLLSRQLDSWSSTTGEAEWHPSSGVTEIVAVVTGIDEAGRIITSSDTFEFLGQPLTTGPSIALSKTSSSTQATVGDTLIYTFRISNAGAGDLTGLTLHDEQLGWIGLPSIRLLVGEQMDVEVAYVVRDADYPGPITGRAEAVGFSSLGDKVEAEARTEVVLVAPLAGGGGKASDVFPKTVVISEIAWGGSASNPDAEWIELANIGSEPVNLSGWNLRWTDKTSTDPQSATWRTLELSGVISPLESTAQHAADLQFVPIGNGLWSLQDALWSSPASSRGYFLLERGSDSTVSSVSAGMIYGSEDDHAFELPDAGAMLVLIDAEGRIVDTANAQHASRRSWPAGNATTGASMERISLTQGDYDANWQTSVGVVTMGVDASGQCLLATAGAANSPTLDLLCSAAEKQIGIMPQPTTFSVPIPSTSEAGGAVIRVTRLAAGGGGGMGAPGISTTRKNGTLTLDVDMANASNGAYLIWISRANGNTLVLPVSK